MANKLADVASSITTTLEFGIQMTTSLELSVATWEKDVAKTEQLMRRTLDNLGKTYDFTKSDLYKHVKFNNFGDNMKNVKSMKKTFIASCKDKKYDYMKGNEWWENLTSSDN